jgi:hypothetical protein
VLDEDAHLPASRVLKGIELIAAGERRWRRRPGWRSFLHGVGSLSIVPIGTYAASANFHQPRDTTASWGSRFCPWSAPGRHMMQSDGTDEPI